MNGRIWANPIWFTTKPHIVFPVTWLLTAVEIDQVVKSTFKTLINIAITLRCGELKVYSQNSLSVPRMNYFFREYSMKVTFLLQKLSISQIHHEFMLFHSLFRIHYQYAINFSNSIWIQFQFHAFAIYFVRIPWIHYLFLSYTINSLSISLIK